MQMNDLYCDETLEFRKYFPCDSTRTRYVLKSEHFHFGNFFIYDREPISYQICLSCKDKDKKVQSISLLRLFPSEYTEMNIICF